MPPQFVLMLNGYAGCLKTTLSYLLAPYLRAAHVSTSLLGPIVSDRDDPDFLRLRETRYERAFQLVGSYLNAGSSVVVDGTFALKRWREQLYSTAAEEGADEILALKCVCGDTGKLENRFEFRKKWRQAPDAVADSMNAYFGSVEEFEPLRGEYVPEDLRFSRIIFDSCEHTVQVLEGGRTAGRVVGLLKRFRRQGRLDEPLFPLSPPRKKLGLISIDGIGGSGKTTQVELLKEKFEKEQSIRATVSREFSDSVLGDWLRSRSERQLRIQYRDDGVVAEHFFVLIDFLSQFTSEPGQFPVTILDGGVLSRLAHMKALSPTDLPDDVWNVVIETTEEVLQNMVGTSNRWTCIYLDCPPDTAVKRLRERGEKINDQDRAFLERLYNAYGKLRHRFPGVVAIDATERRDIVVGRVFEEILELMVTQE